MFITIFLCLSQLHLSLLMKWKPFTFFSNIYVLRKTEFQIYEFLKYICHCLIWESEFYYKIILFCFQNIYYKVIVLQNKHKIMETEPEKSVPNLILHSTNCKLHKLSFPNMFLLFKLHHYITILCCSLNCSLSEA